MNDEERKKYEKELLEDEAHVMEEVNNSPELKSVTAPPEMREILFSRIHARKDGANKRLTDRETELIRLGRIYEKKRKNRKYLALVAVMVLAMAFGITSFGGAEKIFEKVTWMMAGREQSNVDSDDTKPMEVVDEEAAYEEIEKEFGFYPVKLNYLPEGVEFQEATIGDKIQDINIIYGHRDSADIIYIIRPNYRDASLGMDIEDTKIQEHKLFVNEVEITIKQYCIEETGESKWSVEFTYKDVQYLLRIAGLNQEKVEQILYNLYFA